MKKTRDPIVISDDEKKVIDQFIDHLWLEDGLAKNTLESYRFDLMQFSEFLNGNIKKILLEAHQSDIKLISPINLVMSKREVFQD